MIVTLKPRILLIAGFACLYWLAIFTATHLPSVGLGAPRGLDKLAHAAAYAGLAALLCATAGTLRPMGLTVYLAVFGIAAAYGALDEFTQGFVTGRTASVWDWVADITGAGLGIGLIHVACLLWCRNSLSNRKNLDARPLERG